MYDDRTAAGEMLGETLENRGIDPDVVMGVPAGGVVVGEPIAERFGADLGVVATEHVEMASEHHLPVGAVTDTGVSWVDDRVVEAFGIDESRLDAEKQRAFREARTKHEIYAAADEDPTPEGTVAVVDEGVVSGTTMKACVSAVDEVADVRSVAVAPVGDAHAVAELHDFADEVVVPETPSDVEFLGRFYEARDRTLVPGQDRPG